MVLLEPGREPLKTCAALVSGRWWRVFWVLAVTTAVKVGAGDAVHALVRWMGHAYLGSLGDMLLAVLTAFVSTIYLVQALALRGAPEHLERWGPLPLRLD